MSKRINKPVTSIVVMERGGRTLDSKFDTPGCIEIIGKYEVGATSAKAAMEIVKAEFGNARRFFVPNKQVVIAGKPKPTHKYQATTIKFERARSRQRRTSVPHGESVLRRGEIKEIYHIDSHQKHVKA